MECRLVLNNRTDNEITNEDMSGWYHQQLKYYKFRRVRSKSGKSVFYLFFRREEDTYRALRTAKSMKEISLVRYLPSVSVPVESPFRLFPSQQVVDLFRYAFSCHLNEFINVVRRKSFNKSHLFYILRRNYSKNSFRDFRSKLWHNR